MSKELFDKVSIRCSRLTTPFIPFMGSFVLPMKLSTLFMLMTKRLY
jgi:hypothetical protein